MIREAILHIPMSNYAHAIDQEHIVFRLRAARGDLKHCRLFYGDRACRVTPVLFSWVDMETAAGDEYFEYFEVILESHFKRICYYFELDDGEERILYYSDLFRKDTVNERSEYYQFPYNRREDIADAPLWAKNAIIYQIFPDSFATSKRYISKKAAEKEYGGKIVRGKNGGTIRGITENIDYFTELGITCIYINPLFAAGEYHKYDLIDYYNIDPCFGTNSDFRQLVSLCHENDIRVIIDGVFNHCGWNFFAFDDVVANGEKSPYWDWFYRLAFPVVKPDNMEDIPNYECFGYERLMPKINTSNPEVIRYFCDVCRYWIKEYDIDGWRLDVADEVDDNFWREFRKASKAAKPDCFLIGEVWESAGHWLNGDQFDSAMNYDFRKNCRDFFALGSMDAYEFDCRVTQMRMRYRRNMLYAQLNLLDSHDVPRFISLCRENSNKFKLAVLFQLTFIGPPSIYYGDELEMAGLTEEDYRSPMRWEKESEMFSFYHKLITLRKQYEALRSGDYRTLYAGKGNGLYIFERFINGESVVIGFNGGDKEEKLSVSLESREILLEYGYQDAVLSAYGYVIAK